MHYYSYTSLLIVIHTFIICHVHKPCSLLLHRNDILHILAVWQISATDCTVTCSHSVWSFNGPEWESADNLRWKIGPTWWSLLCNLARGSWQGSHRPGKVMEFNPWLEKSLDFMLTWKNGILPGKVIKNQWKSLKNFMCNVKFNLNTKTMMIIWLKISL